MPQMKRAVSCSPTTGLWRCWCGCRRSTVGEAGRWYLEHGFGKLDGLAHLSSTDLDEAQDWVAQRIS